jgi:hypothetical protein
MIQDWLRRKRPARARRVAPHAEWLEPRLLYSADAPSLLLASADTDTDASETRVLDTSFEYSAQAAATPTAAEVRSAYALTPLQFEADAGQLGEGVDFAAAGIGYAVRLGGGQAELLLDGAEQTVRLELVGADSGTAVGENLLATRSNYLLGQDASQWVTDIANYDSVLYRGVYDGIDVRYYGNQSQLEYDFLLAPGADASQLQLRFHGSDNVSLDANGDLVLRVAGTERELRFQAPVSYQQGTNGREDVESHYELQADGTVRIVVGAYDTSRALVVDPVLLHATYFGEGGAETALGVAVGADGSVYVTGHTTSSSGTFGTRLATGSDGNEAYVAKFNADLTSLVYATRVGGTGNDQGTAIAVDATGNAVVTGWTRSNDFAGISAASDQTTRDGTQDAFVFKLNAAGNALVFSSYFGGSGNTDTGAGIAVDANGVIYAVGTVSDATDDAFLNKYSATGTSLGKMLYGGSGGDGARGVAVDSAGNVYVAGQTLSSDLAIVGGAETVRPGLEDGFLVKYSAAGVLSYSTYIGHTKADTITGVAADDSGRAYVVGHAKDPSQGFVTTAGAFATTAYTHETGFLRIYDTTASGAGSMVYSTFIGGSKDAGGTLSGLLTEVATGVAVGGGRVAIVGHTDTSDFPTTSDAVSRTNTSGKTGFVIVLTPQGGGGNDLVYGTYYGTGMATGGVAWGSNRVYVVGSVTVNGLATTDGFRPTYGSGGDGVVATFGAFPNIAPVLGGAMNLPAQLEDAAAGSGTLVADLVAGTITDGDMDALRGIAVTAVDTGNGIWQYSLDGGTWSTLANPSGGSALLLAADTVTRVRFLPNADYAGTNSITFRAWDRTAGVSGSVVTVASTGGNSAFSTATATATVAITAVNDAPVTSDALVAVTAPEGATVSLGLGGLSYLPGGGVDELGQTHVYTVTQLPGSAGTIQLADGTAVAVGSSYTLAELQNMRFQAAATGTGTFGFRVTDSGGTANGGQDTLAQSMTLTVTNVAPVLTTPVNALTQLEDLPGNGTLVSDMIDGKVALGAYGIAVTSVPNANTSNGLWQYSLDGGASWLTLTGSNTSSRLLGPDARVRFVGDAGENINGSVPGFTFRAWDGSSGVSGGTANTNPNGGITAFSTATGTAALTIAPVNDIPVRYDISAGALLPPPSNVTVKETAVMTSLGFGNLEYIAGYALDEYNTQTLTYTVTGVPGAGVGTVYLADAVTAVTAGTSYSIAQIQGMRFKAATGVQNATGTFSWSVKDDAGTADGGVDTLLESITIKVENVAPTLSGANVIPGIAEDTPGNGIRVDDLVTGRIVDPANSYGIAVTGAPATSAGTWEYTSNGGTSWTSLGAASTTNAILLPTGGQWRVRFNPGANWNGTPPGFTFRAWDRSIGSAGGTADTTVAGAIGGTGAFSTNAVAATITVGAVNDGPARTDAVGTPLAPVVLLDGSPLTPLGLAGVTFGPGGGTDEAAQTIQNYIITALPSTLGTTYLADGTTAVVLGATYTLAQIQGMQFLSYGEGALDTEAFSFAVRDSGGTTSGGTNTTTFSVNVIVNRAPVLNGANSPLTVYEDFDWSGNVPSGSVPMWANPAQRSGAVVSDMVAGQIFDNSGSLAGIAVIGTSGSGTWQYTTDGGNTWTTIPSVSDSGALQLAADAQTRVRFLPSTDWNSTMATAGLTFRAWDRTTGAAGTLGDATWNGGASAYSATAATSVITVIARNDAPVAVGVTGGSVEEGAPAATMLSSGTFAPGPVLTATDEAAQTLAFRFTSISDRVQVLLADGVTVVDLGTSYTLAQFQGMLFRSATNATPGSAEVKFEVQDSGGVDNGGTDKSTHTLTLAVMNRAPVLNGANPMAAILEDTLGNGTLVADLVAGQVADPTGTRGIAVTGVDRSHGTWQYTRDGGTTWSAFGAPDAGSSGCCWPIR